MHFHETKLDQSMVGNVSLNKIQVNIGRINVLSSLTRSELILFLLCNARERPIEPITKP